MIVRVSCDAPHLTTSDKKFISLIEVLRVGEIGRIGRIGTNGKFLSSVSVPINPIKRSVPINPIITKEVKRSGSALMPPP